MQLDNEIKLEKITLYTATQIYDTKNNIYGFLDFANLDECLPPEIKVLAMDSEEYTLIKKNKEISNVAATDPVKCNVCNYEIASHPNDYPPDCGGSGDSQCNECIQCLLLCDCKPKDSCPECEGTNLNTDATKCWDCSGQN